ncbi:hypothetical protein [Lentilactobacillus buchneri]|uniref:hypothetical protein n=1 Tax=Lentilactobacillus buchneri TaxID=1581 RepID=UPI001291AB8D|nr:hypothetical protein [Lentilactobacillus buchneri]MQN24493.1 hypothetical protein [Lentilactobacillus buchneri]
MEHFFTIGLPYWPSHKQYIFNQYVEREIQNDEYAFRQLIVILTKMSQLKYDVDTGIIEKMVKDPKGHLVFSTYVTDNFGRLVNSKIIELLNRSDRPCYEIRINAAYEKRRILFITSRPTLSDPKEHQPGGYYIHFGFTKSELTDPVRMNELTNGLASDSVDVITKIENQHFSEDIFRRWKVAPYSRKHLEGGAQ